MNAQRLFPVALLAAFTPSLNALAQSPSLNTLDILPPVPVASADVLAQLGGTVNVSGTPIIRTESRRINNDVRVDVLIDELPVAAPPVIMPWMRSENLGMLPAGTYRLTVRLFWDFRFGFVSSFPDPWTFPDSYGQPLFPGANGTLTATFAVVPEPTGISLAVVGVAMFGALARRLAT